MCPGSLANFPEGIGCHIHVLRHCPRSRTPSLQSRFAFHTSQRSGCRVPCSWPEASTCATRGRRTSRIRGTNSPSSSRTSRRSHAPSPYILRNDRVESLDQVLCVSLSGFTTNMTRHMCREDMPKTCMRWRLPRICGEKTTVAPPSGLVWFAKHRFINHWPS